MGKHETEAMREIMIRVSEMGHRVWRNNRGLFYTRNGVPIICGLSNGSGDLIGISSTGRMISIEVKSESGRLQPEQRQWMDMINNMGGIGICAKKPEEAEEKIKKALSENQKRF